MKKVAVIGAGPAGMSAAIAAAQNGSQVDLFDHNEKVGKKLFITGKGRCNLTNSRPIEDFFEQIPTNSNFLYSSLYSFSNDMLMDLIESTGVKLKTERGGRVFPQSDKSSDILKAFKRLLEKENVNIFLNSNVTEILCEKNKCTGIKIKGKNLYYDSVILCSGGVSYPQTGSDGSGYKLVKNLGHSIIEPEPALVGLKTVESWPGDLSGLTLRNIGLKLLKGNKVVFSDQGEALFTHSGISGPVVLSASSFLKSPYKDYSVLIDLKPGLDEKKLNERLLRDFNKFINKDFQNSLNELLPKSLIPVIISLSGITPNKKVNSITKEERLRLVKLLKNLPLQIDKPLGIAGAIITRGGINTKEIDPTSMESRIIKNLYFAGEIIDVDALTGGFNIQIACSTGYLAGISASGG